MELSEEKLREHLERYTEQGSIALDLPDDQEERAIYLKGLNKGLELVRYIMLNYTLFRAEGVLEDILEIKY